jgi:hypothetical protein
MTRRFLWWPPLGPIASLRFYIREIWGEVDLAFCLCGEGPIESQNNLSPRLYPYPPCSGLRVPGGLLWRSGLVWPVLRRPGRCLGGVE